MADTDGQPSEPDLLDPYRFRPAPTLSGAEVAEKAGLGFEIALKVNRALGFPDAEPSEVLFDERDVEVLRNVKSLLDLGIPVNEVISVARVYGQSLAAIADAETRLFNDHLVAPLLEQGIEVTELEERLEPTVERQLDLLGDALDYVHRRHLAMALHNVTLTQAGQEDASEKAAIAFVDLVDFSRLADELHGTELGELVDRFEDEVVDAVTKDAGIRIVKMIGDAAMLTAKEPRQLVGAAMEIVDRVERDERMTQARAGLDFGDILPLGGDLFGRPVNVAARLVAFARPGTTVVSQELLEHLADAETSKIGTHKLKGVGRIRMFKMRALDGTAQTDE